MTDSGNTNSNEDILLNEVHKKVSVLQELYIEFFATLIPGFVMTLSILVLLFLFHFFTYKQLLFTAVLSEHINPWIGFISILFFSYTCGAILYRKDPNIPDKIASYIQWRKSSPDEKKRLAVQYQPYSCKQRCPSCKISDNVVETQVSQKSRFILQRLFFSAKWIGLIRISVSCTVEHVILLLFPALVIPPQGFDGYPYRYLRQYLSKRCHRQHS